jgi:hypothetical protein
VGHTSLSLGFHQMNEASLRMQRLVVIGSLPFGFAEQGAEHFVLRALVSSASKMEPSRLRQTSSHHVERDDYTNHLAVLPSLRKAFENSPFQQSLSSATKSHDPRV